MVLKAIVLFDINDSMDSYLWTLINDSSDAVSELKSIEFDQQ